MKRKLSEDRLRKIRLKKIFKKLRKEMPELWPELDDLDYLNYYKISKSEYYKADTPVYAVRPVERLFEFIAMLGGDRDEAVRALIFMEIIIEADKLYLDVKRAREDLGIEELVKKYMED